MIAAKHVRMSGVILLVAGLLAAAIIFCTARPGEQLEIPGMDLTMKRDSLQLERIGGKSYILFTDFNEWLASLRHGRRLAYTIGILSIAGFVGSRWFADLLENAPASDESANGQNT
jgi:hypothetical protein